MTGIAKNRLAKIRSEIKENNNELLVHDVKDAMEDKERDWTQGLLELQEQK